MREVAGLRGKRDTLFDARPLDAPMGDDGDDTLLDLISAPWEEYPVELEELRNTVRAAVSRIGNRKAREAIQAVYRDSITIAEYARKEGISVHGVGERLRRGYAILRKDPSIIALALAEGYCNEYFRYRRGVEDTIIQQEQTERKRSGLYRQLGRVAEEAHHRQTALFRQLGELAGLSRS